MVQDPQRDLIRSILVVTILGLLLLLSVWILKPFLPALIWATMVAVATWPMMLAVQARVGRRRWIAVLVMTIAMLLVFIVPFALAIGTLVSNLDEITGWLKSFDVHSLETPPSWVGGLPLVGPHLDSAWRDLASTAELGDKITPYAGKLATWLLGQLGGFGALIVQFLLTVVMSAILYAKGEATAEAILRVAHRIGGERGEAAVILASKAIRGVALGVVVTALVQAVLGGIGLAIVGVPYVPILTAAMFLFGVAQIGAGPVLFCAVAWVFWKGDTGWGIALLVWAIVVSTMDNFLRPVLIRKGADLPILLIFVGVIGGLIAFGVVGIFVGPIVLAVTYTLIAAWISEAPPKSVPSKSTRTAARD